jgi:hypothetical protein
MRLWYCLACVAALVLETPDEGATLIVEAETASEEAAKQLQDGFSTFSSWCAATVAQREWVYNTGKSDETSLQEAKLFQHTFVATAEAEIANLEKQTTELAARRKTAASQIEAEQDKFVAESADRVAMNASLASAVDTLRSRYGTESVLLALKHMESKAKSVTARSPFDVVVGTLQQMMDEVVAEEEEAADELEKRVAQLNDVMDSLNDQTLHVEMLKRSYKHMSIAAESNLITYEQMFEIANTVDTADARVLEELRTLCRASKGDNTSAVNAFASLDNRLYQLRRSMEKVVPAAAALLRLSSKSAGPAEAAAALSAVPGGRQWKRLIKTVSGQSVEKDVRLLTSLDSALQREEDAPTCTEVVSAKAKVIQINAEFDAAFMENSTASAELDGVNMKIKQIKEVANESGLFLSYLDGAMSSLAEADQAATEKVTKIQAQVKEAGALLAAHHEQTGDPAAGGIQASIDSALAYIDTLLEKGFIGRARAQNGTLVQFTTSEYATVREKLGEYRDDEDDVEKDLGKSNRTLLNIVDEWKVAREEVKEAEKACAESTVLWAHKISRSTTERLVISAAMRALRAGPGVESAHASRAKATLRR